MPASAPSFPARLGFIQDAESDISRAKWFDFNVTPGEFAAIEHALEQDGGSLVRLGYSAQGAVWVKNDDATALRPHTILENLPHIYDGRLMQSDGKCLGDLAALQKKAGRVTAGRSIEGDGPKRVEFKVHSRCTGANRGAWSFPVLVNNPDALVDWGQDFSILLDQARRGPTSSYLWYPVRIQVRPFDPLPTARQGLSVALRWLRKNSKAPIGTPLMPALEGLLANLRLSKRLGQVPLPPALPVPRLRL